MSEELLTVVLYTKNDALKFLRDKPHVGRVYPLTPDARVELIGNTDLPILDPLDYFNDYGHLRVVARVKRVETILYPLIYNEKDLSDAAKVTFRSMFHMLACEAFYIFYLIREVGPWLINYGNSWYRCDELTVAHKMLFSEISKGRWGLFSPPKIRTSLIQGPYRFLNRIILGFLNGKQCIWITENNYGMPELKKHLRKNDPSVYLLILSPLKISKRFFYRYFMRMLKIIFKKEKEIGIMILPSSVNPQILGILNNALNEIRDSIFDDVKEVISPFLASTIGYTESLTAYTNYYFEKVTSICYITDHLRWMEAAVCGEAAKKNNVRSILIAQGTNPYCTDAVSWYVYQALAHGLLVSSLADETVIQTPSSKVAAIKLMPGLKRRQFQPIMFGYKKIKKAKNKIRTIIHAGTYKPIAGRPWMYETSNEFVYGLQQLVMAINTLENTRMIIRIREASECSVSSLKKLLPITGNIELSTSGDLLDDLGCADLLISFSSTTIDEALYVRKPVGLFGGSIRYRYYPGSSIPPTVNERHAVYHLQKENLSTMLNAILDAHKNNPLTDKELEGYVWPSSVPERQEFIENILN